MPRRSSIARSAQKVASEHIGQEAASNPRRISTIQPAGWPTHSGVTCAYIIKSPACGRNRCTSHFWQAVALVSRAHALSTYPPHSASPEPHGWALVGSGRGYVDRGRGAPSEVPTKADYDQPSPP